MRSRLLHRRGDEWGERGFFRIARGDDESAFESMAVAVDITPEAHTPETEREDRPFDHSGGGTAPRVWPGREEESGGASRRLTSRMRRAARQGLSQRRHALQPDAEPRTVEA